MYRIATVFLVVLIASSSARAGALFDAAYSGDIATVKDLLDKGVAADEPGRNAETPLMAASLTDNTAIAQLLIDHGADVMARNEGGLTPLHAAAYSGSADVASLLLDHGAALEDNVNVSGATPLIVAAEENNVAVAEILIARGADLSVPDRDGFTALTQAWAKKRTTMVRLLKHHGAACQPVEILGTEDYHRQCVEAGI